VDWDLHEQDTRLLDASLLRQPELFVFLVKCLEELAVTIDAEFLNTMQSETMGSD